MTQYSEMHNHQGRVITPFCPTVLADAATLPNTANIQSQFQSFFGSNRFLTFPYSTLNHTNCKFLWGKGKVFPCPCHEVIHWTVQVYLHSFLTLTLDTGVWSTSHPRERTMAPIQWEAEQSPEPAWTFKRRETSVLIWTPDHPPYRLVTICTMLLQLILLQAQAKFLYSLPHNSYHSVSFKLHPLSGWWVTNA
jgi:hypothetical protein